MPRKRPARSGLAVEASSLLPPVSPPQVDATALSPEQVGKVRGMMEDHLYNFTGQTDLNPIEEQRFLGDIMKSGWFRGYQRSFKESPNLKDQSYDYRGAWKAGVPMPGAGEHWPSRTPDGQWLKSPYHPTAWMEYYQSVTGQDPHAAGVDRPLFNRMMGQRDDQDATPPDPDTTMAGDE